MAVSETHDFGRGGSLLHSAMDIRRRESEFVPKPELEFHVPDTPGMKHGPYVSQPGALLFEVRYYLPGQKKK